MPIDMISFKLTPDNHRTVRHYRYRATTGDGRKIVVVSTKPEPELEKAGFRKAGTFILRIPRRTAEKLERMRSFVKETGH